MHGFSIAKLLGLTVCVWLVGLQVRAEDVRLHVRVARDACPSAALLRQKLEPLLGDDQADAFDVSDGLVERPLVTQAAVFDRGAHYRIEAAGQSRELDDAARDCVERARVAAVFIALNAPPAAAPSKPRALQVGARVFGEAAYATSIDRASGGGGVGVWFGYACWRFDVAAAALSPVRAALRPSGSVQASASLLRVPLAVSAACMFDSGRLSFGPLLGVGLDVLRIKGAGAERPQTALRVDPGVLAAAAVHLQLTAAWALGLRLGVDWLARAYDLDVKTLGSLGKTPHLWLSASLGLEWRFL